MLNVLYCRSEETGQFVIVPVQDPPTSLQGYHR